MGRTAAVGSRGSTARRAFPAGAVALALASSACARAVHVPIAAPPGGDAHAGTHFTVVCHFRCGSAGVRALEAAELAWRLTQELVGGAEPEAVERPIHLYRTEAEYEAAEARLTGGRFRLNRAMTYRGSEAHIAVHPHLGTAALTRFGLTSNTLRVVAHEAAHMALRALSPRTRDLPDWLDEGLATSLELDVLMALGLAPDRTEEPVSGTRLHLLQERLRRGALPPLAALLDGREEGLSLAERYAFYQYFIDFLRQGEFEPRLSATLRSLDALGGSGPRVRRAILPAVVGDTPARLLTADRAFRAWLASLEPGWVQARRALSTDGDAWLQVGFDSGAEAWRWTPVQRPPYVLEGTVELLDGGTRTASVLLALGTNARLALVFAPTEVRVERLRYPDDPTPVVLARRTLSADTGPVPFRIRVEPDAVTVTVREVDLLRSILLTDGRWGLAAGPAANVVWRGVGVASTPAPAPGAEAAMSGPGGTLR